jgi:hypothetical protein
MHLNLVSVGRFPDFLCLLRYLLQASSTSGATFEKLWAMVRENKRIAEDPRSSNDSRNESLLRAATLELAMELATETFPKVCEDCQALLMLELCISRLGNRGRNYACGWTFGMQNRACKLCPLGTWHPAWVGIPMCALPVAVRSRT